MLVAPRLFVGLTLSLSLVAPGALAQPLEQSRGGRLGCPGFQLVTTNPDEITFFAYPMHNYNPDRTLTITSMTIYDTDGTVLKAFPVPDPFPAGFNNVLGPFQTTIFSTLAVFGSDASPGLMEVIVNWTADGKAFDLFANITRIVRGPASEVDQETRGTAMLRCVTLR